MDINRAFIVTLTVDSDTLIYVEQLAADIQADLLDAGYVVTQVKPWPAHSDTPLEVLPPTNPGGGIPLL